MLHSTQTSNFKDFSSEILTKKTSLSQETTHFTQDETSLCISIAATKPEKEPQSVTDLLVALTQILFLSQQECSLSQTKKKQHHIQHCVKNFTKFPLNKCNSAICRREGEREGVISCASNFPSKSKRQNPPIQQQR